MKHFSAQATRDRAQIAQFILTLTHAALQPRQPATDAGNVNGKASPALPDRPSGDLPAWTVVNPFRPFRPFDASADLSSQSLSAQRTHDSELLPLAAQASNAIAITRASHQSCPALRRHLKARGGCARHVVGKPISMALKTAQSTLYRSNVLSIRYARPNRPEPPCWLDRSDPVAAAMQRWAGSVFDGWHALLEQTLRKLLSMARSPARRSALKDLNVFCHDIEMGFSLPDESDTALRGIARRAQVISRCTCSTCGGAGRRREIGEDNSVTLCARCAAPLLLGYDIWELQQSIRFLRAVNVPVVESQIPALLRSSFRRKAVAHPEEFGPGGKVRMNSARFLAWAGQWQAIGERIVGGPD